MYDGEELPEPNVGEWAALHDDPATAANANAWRGKMSRKAIRRARTGYLGEISFIDSQIGRLDNWLRRNQPETYADTWFVLTADHGDMQGDHNLWRKTYAYEGSTRIPFILVPPRNSRFAKEKNLDQVVELRDFMPTILDAAGVPVPDDVDGSSVLPLMEGRSVEWRGYIHGEHCKCYSHEQEMQYVTDGRRKFIWLPRIDVEQFFDLEADPGELHNLIDVPERAAEVAEWRQYLVNELESRDCGWVVDGELRCPPDSPLVSPYKDVRWKP